jgi:O-antigen ligase
MNTIRITQRWKSIISDSIEKIIVISLSASAGILFFTQRRNSIYDALSMGALLLWRFLLRNGSQRRLPKSLIIWTILYLISYGIGALISENQHWPFPELDSFRYVFIAGLLFTAPIPDKDRKIIIIFLFVAAALSGLIGILQYFGLIYMEYPRPHGFSPHPILYASMLSFVCSSSVIMFFIPNNNPFQTKKERYFLLIIILLTFGGILLSGSRGAWLALVIACSIALFLYDRKKTFNFLLVLTMSCLIVLPFSNSLRQRATSILSAIHGKDIEGSLSIETRIELWKGALLIFRESPILGSGIWDFETDIDKLVKEKKLNNVATAVHAHNIFFQALATRGLMGLIFTIGLLSALMIWGMKEIQCEGGIGGYIIILCTVLTIIGGFTEDNIETTKYLAIYGITIGLIGPYGVKSSKGHCSAVSDSL